MFYEHTKSDCKENFVKKATKHQTKAHNRILILNIIYDQNDVSRAEIAKITGLTRATVSDIVAELIAEGLVLEIGQGQSSGGKPPTLLEVNAEAREIFGIDFASGEFCGAICNLRGEIKKSLSFPIKDRSGEDVLAIGFELIDKLFELSNVPVLGIGIGSPGLLNTKEGIVRTSVNLGWKDFPLGRILSERYHLPVCIANDCNVSALAEHSFGKIRSPKNLVLIKIGLGVGAGIVLDHKLFYGDGAGAGEIGHVKVDDNGELCACGNYGCLESKISSTAIRRRAIQVAYENPDSLLNKESSNIDDIRMEDIAEAFRQDDPYVREIIRDVSKDLSKVLSVMTSVLNIQHIVIAGDLSTFGEDFLKLVTDNMEASVLPAIMKDTKVLASSMGNEIVMRGAAAMILQKELGIL